MVRSACCSRVGLRRGPWTDMEDKLLLDYIHNHGGGNWKYLPNNAGLLRCGKSCRMRWLNYLRPDIKRGNISPDEDDLIIRLHTLLGNRWSLIAKRLPGRTDNEIKNYWNTNLSKKFEKNSEPDPQNIHQTKCTCKKKHTKNKRAIKIKKKEISIARPDQETIKKTKIYFPKPRRLSPTDIDNVGSWYFYTSHLDEEIFLVHDASETITTNLLRGSEPLINSNLDMDLFDDSMSDIEFESFVDSILT